MIYIMKQKVALNGEIEDDYGLVIESYTEEIAIDDKISDTLMISMQQAAVWYFSNEMDETSAENWIGVYNGNSYVLFGNDTESRLKYQFATALYNYLIQYAIDNHESYQNGSTLNGTTINAYFANNNLTSVHEEQPVAIISRKYEPKEFDLALRKHITKITSSTGEVKFDSRTATSSVNRIPQISTPPTFDLDTNNTTATKSHVKTALAVENGDEVTYEINVYNEGNIDGTGIEVTDYLPEGLEYKSGEWTKGTTSNGYTAYTKTYGDLKAYDGGNSLPVLTNTITCRVTANADATNRINLKNVTEITKATNANKVDDRDSTPNNLNTSISDYSKYDAADATKGKGYQDDDDFEPLYLKPTENEFDLALRKHITKITSSTGKVKFDSTKVSTASNRIPQISTPPDFSLGDSSTTAVKAHTKKELEVEEGDIVEYQIDVYNEGDVKGTGIEVTDYLPSGLEYKSGDWTKGETVNGYTAYTKTYGDLDKYEGGNSLPIISNKITCTVTQKANTTDTMKLKNVAEITKASNSDNIADRDSTPGNLTHRADYNVSTSEQGLGYQDDDDLENLVMKAKEFDLKLIKRITEINGKAVEERIQSVDVSALNTANATDTTAIYKLNKNPLLVNSGDIVTYTFRVYNEGYIDGYAQEITEDIPEGLEFLWSNGRTEEELRNDTTLTDEEREAIKYNEERLWTFNQSGKTIKTTRLSSSYSKEDNLIPAFGANDGTKTENDLKYKEVSVKFKVKAANSSGVVIKNEAQITKDADKDENEVDDRDSDTGIGPGVSDEKGSTVGDYDDDEDYDNIKLQTFDLALRKFIIAVSHDENVEDAEYLKNSDGTYTRAPVVDTSKLNKEGEDGKIVTTATYNHTKEPIELTAGDYVIYTLRVFNEGELNGYAAEIKDHLPSQLTYVDNSFNKEYGWSVSEDGKTVTTSYLNNKLINAAKTGTDGAITLSYEDVPIMCKVSPDVQSNYKVTNLADISKYEDENHNSVKDRDSSENNVNVPTDGEFPGYKDGETGTYIPGQEDDDDFEKVIVKIFDLALRKWVTQAIVIEDGNQTVTETGHQPYDDPEDIVKVEINRKKTKSTTVKFRFSIRVYNQGDIAGYATEVTDYIPAGLEMIEEENPEWTNVGNNVIKTTALDKTLLQPGEYADLDVLLTWINSDENIGSVMDNVAEISKDYNDKGIPDIDSIPGNKKDGEDDIDDAPVLVSISTGKAVMYIGLGAVVLVTLAGGVTLIKKYLL